MGDTTVVVLQIGSTRAGFAYKQANCTSVTVNKEWESWPTFQYKNRVALLYTSEGMNLSVDSWGFNSFERYMIFLRKKQTNYHLIRNIPFSESELSANNNPNNFYIQINDKIQISLEEFFFDYLKQMKKFVIKILENNNLFKSEQSIKWCIYRPNNWSESVVGKLVKAAYHLNMVNRQFLIISNLINNPKLNNENVILFDVGSDRVTAISKQSQLTLFNEGGNKFNILFLEYLKSKCLRRTARGHPIEELSKKFFYDKFSNRIEEFKVSFFNPITTDTVSFEIPLTVAKFLWDEFSAVIQNLDQSINCFILPTSDIMGIFEKTIQPIVDFIAQFISATQNSSTKLMITGGFSQCFFLMDRIKQQIPRSSAIKIENIFQDETFALKQSCIFASLCGGTNFNVTSNNYVQSPLSARRAPCARPRSATTPVNP